MNAEVIFVIFNYSVIPFVFAIIITILVIEGYRKLKLNSFFKHNTDLTIYEIDKRTRIQASKIELISNQFDIVNEKIKKVYEMINMLEEKIDDVNVKKSESQYSIIPQMRNFVGNLSDNAEQYNHNNISQNHNQGDQNDERKNGTIEYILKKLEHTSLSTKEIQNLIGRTREHTSRLMKKLYEQNLVIRDITTKPFKYTITDEGRKRLSKHSSLRIHSRSYSDSESPLDQLIKN